MTRIMILLVSILIAGVSFFAVAIFFGVVIGHRYEEMGLIVGIIVGILFGVISFFRIYKFWIIDDSKKADLYARAEEECDRGEMDKDLWSQALVKAKGNEHFRKVEYIKLRVKQLKKQARETG